MTPSAAHNDDIVRPVGLETDREVRAFIAKHGWPLWFAIVAAVNGQMYVHEKHDDDARHDVHKLQRGEPDLTVSSEPRVPLHAPSQAVGGALPRRSGRGNRRRHA